MVLSATRLQDAETHVALAENALNMLEGDREREEAHLAAATRLKAVGDHRDMVAKRGLAAVELDKAAGAFNAAYDTWKASVEAAHAAQPKLSEHFGWSPLWPMVGAGVVGSTSLHPEVVRDLVNLRASAPERNPVAKTAHGQ
jgi:hypothetical protein